MVVFLRSKTFEDECKLEDPWYHTKYSKEPFSSSLKELLMNP
jgi:hypothetical protein